jgi:hypothetical protein
MKRGIKQLDRFVKQDLPKLLLEPYKRHEILSEADLQAIAYQLVADYLIQQDPNRQVFQVFNRLYLKDVRIHPDIVIFKRNKPWVLFELKERRRRLTVRVATKERERLIKAREILRQGGLKARRGYLIHVAPFGDRRVLLGPKGRGARYFFEVPILLCEHWSDERVTKWTAAFAARAKFKVRFPRTGRPARSPAPCPEGAK